MITWFLPAILIFGFIISYTDIKEGKIKNKYLAMMLLYSFVAYLIMFLISPQIRYGYFIELLVMSGFSLIVGIVIWYAGLWTAADSKLFFAYSVMVPLSVYKYGYTPYLSSINILINTFVPMFIFLFTYAVIKTDIKQKLFCLKSSFSLQQLFNLGVYLFTLIWLIKLIFPFPNIVPLYFISVFTMFLLITVLEKIFLIRGFNILIIVSIIRLIFDKTVYSLSFLYQFMVLFVIFIFLRFFVITLGFSVFKKEVEIGSLKPGMVPAEEVIQSKKRYRKQKVLYFGIFPLFQKKAGRKSVIKSTAEGLTEKDIRVLEKLKHKLGFESLAIQTTIPFAPFIFAGVLLTILFKGNMFFSIITLLKNILF